MFLELFDSPHDAGYLFIYTMMAFWLIAGIVIAACTRNPATRKNRLVGVLLFLTFLLCYTGLFAYLGKSRFDDQAVTFAEAAIWVQVMLAVCITCAGILLSFTFVLVDFVKRVMPVSSTARQ